MITRRDEVAESYYPVDQSRFHVLTSMRQRSIASSTLLADFLLHHCDLHLSLVHRRSTGQQRRIYVLVNTVHCFTFAGKQTVI